MSHNIAPSDNALAGIHVQTGLKLLTPPVRARPPRSPESQHWVASPSAPPERLPDSDDKDQDCSSSGCILSLFQKTDLTAPDVAIAPFTSTEAKSAARPH